MSNSHSVLAVLGKHKAHFREENISITLVVFYFISVVLSDKVSDRIQYLKPVNTDKQLQWQESS